MTRAISLAIAAICAGQSQALHQKLKDHIATRSEQADPTDVWDDQWNAELYPIVRELDRWDIFLNDTLPSYPFNEGDEDRKPERDVTILTLDDYDRIFFGPKPNTDKWFIAIFADDDYDWSHCQQAMAILQVMASERDDWRFGAFLRSTDAGQSLVQMTDSYTLPNFFLFEPNEQGQTMVFEGPMMIQYLGFLRWMDSIPVEGNETHNFRDKLTFKPAYPAPASFKSGSMKWTINEYHRTFHTWFIGDGTNDMIFFLKNNYYDGKTLHAIVGLEDWFEDLHPMDRTQLAERVIAVAALMALLMLLCSMYCVCYCCCSSSKATKKPASVADATPRKRAKLE